MFVALAELADEPKISSSEDAGGLQVENEGLNRSLVQQGQDLVAGAEKRGVKG